MQYVAIIKEIVMKYLLILLILPLSIFATDKFYYRSNGWFSSSDAIAIGTTTNKGDVECAATILDNGRPVPRSWVKLSNGKVKCPVEIDQARKDLALAEDADRALLDLRMKKISFGQLLIGKIANRNDVKGLTLGQYQTLSAQLTPIQNLLSSGSLDTAKMAVQAITADGTIITEADKTFAINEIDTFLNSL